MELTPENIAILDCFKDFIKYNPHLQVLDLSNTKLNNPAILYLAYILRRALQLQTLFLSGNMSRPRDRDEKSGVFQLEDEDDPLKSVITKVEERLHAKVS